MLLPSSCSLSATRKATHTALQEQRVQLDGWVFIELQHATYPLTGLVCQIGATRVIPEVVRVDK